MFRKNFSIFSLLLLTFVPIFIFAMNESTSQVKEEVINFFLCKCLKKFDEADLSNYKQCNEVMKNCAICERLTAEVGLIKKSNTFKDNINEMISDSSTEVEIYIEYYSMVSENVFKKKYDSEYEAMKKEMDNKAKGMRKGSFFK